MKKALIVIDMQNDYFKNGNMELVGVNAALKRTNDLVKFAREQEYKIYFVQHVSVKEGSSFFVPNTKGVKLHKKLDIQNATIIEKNYPNSFRETNLKKELDKENTDELIICGAMTHMCIDTTVRAAFDLGYKITLAHDACATRDLMLRDEVIKRQF
ncbi:cysteine hydrolase family protein [Sulfurimonas sp.]|uniref:cysteine hydrolase family protein n=1 Tax=Sulfurimonas sp. TaxID=2022749 RepID=UPI0025EDFF2D|nr:cysteine hydrolase family protein [Sulfurimonas sp.]